MLAKVSTSEAKLESFVSGLSRLKGVSLDWESSIAAFVASDNFIQIAPTLLLTGDKVFISKLRGALSPANSIRPIKIFKNFCAKNFPRMLEGLKQTKANFLPTSLRAPQSTKRPLKNFLLVFLR